MSWAGIIRRISHDISRQNILNDRLAFINAVSILRSPDSDENILSVTALPFGYRDRSTTGRNTQIVGMC